MEHVDVEGLRICYERAGSGPTILLLHGFIGDGRSTWSAQLDDLSDEFTVVAWDAPGSGQSSLPPASFRANDYADCLAAFVRALRLDPLHLVGLSFGGIVALELFRRRAVVPRRLVLAGAYAGWAGSLPADAVGERLRVSLDRADLPPDQFVEAMLSSMFSASAPAEAVAAFGASVRAFSPAGFRAMTWASAEADLRDVLGTVDVPTLLLYGDHDTRAPLAVAHALHTAITGSELVVLPGVGHVSPVEAPELFNRELRGFLTRTTA
ncbi:alpha/beta hydrolase [Asanoa sp. WMMD1127]|uniref:alpha/beta fold hydrolase n=1 Tax=Asanoa sp. WMMD1127 TaxID=3016107 RepID=UPI00241664FF|nr:alpha/beta hydrolase [Asanoa sp. WMMD1127]MDG4820578.1 alpha/beta hydrolase [Asanoa sp. WMMD1127]